MSEEGVQNEPAHRRLRNRPAVLPTVEVMLQCFENSLELDVAEGDASPDTVKTYQSRLNQYLNWCKTQQLNPALADAENIKQFRRHLIERNLKSNTIGLTLTAIRRFYEAAVAKKLIKENPAAGIKPPRKKTNPDGEFTYLEKEELQALLQTIPKDGSMMALRDRALIALMALQGPRGVELHNASVGDLIQSDKGWELRVGSKRSIRKIPLRPDLSKAVWDYLDARERAGENLNSNSPLFLNLNWANPGKRLTRRGIRVVVDKYLEVRPGVHKWPMAIE